MTLLSIGNEYLQRRFSDSNKYVTFVGHVDGSPGRDGNEEIYRVARMLFKLPLKKGVEADGRTFLLFWNAFATLKGHFDVYVLHRKMEEANYHVSRATVYNTIEVLVECGLVVRHQFPGFVSAV